MLNALRAGIELSFVAVASMLFALAGLCLSVAASLYASNPPNVGTSPAPLRLKSPARVSRDRDALASPARKQHSRRHSQTSTQRTQVVVRPESPDVPRTPPSPPVHDTQDQPGGSPKRRCASSKRRRQVSSKPDQAMSSIDTAVDIMEKGEITLAMPPRNPLRKSQSTFTPDSSSIEEHPSEPGRGVLSKIREHHHNLRDRCLVRAQSMPITKQKQSRPVQRTDPYQAPYFFPTPLSPDAGTYVQEVLSERHRVPNSKLPRPNSLTSDPSSEIASPTRSTRVSVEVSSPLPSPPAPASPVDATPEAERASSPSATNRRWSWHLPKRTVAPGRTRSVDPPERVAGGEREKKPISLFGHKRRHGGSQDLRTEKAT